MFCDTNERAVDGGAGRKEWTRRAAVVWVGGRARKRRAAGRLCTMGVPTGVRVVRSDGWTALRSRTRAIPKSPSFAMSWS
jgi:hypothetical protein